MTDFKIRHNVRPVAPQRHPSDMDLNDQTAELLEMASLLSPRDMATLSVIVRRAAEISESEGLSKQKNARSLRSSLLGVTTRPSGPK